MNKIFQGSLLIISMTLLFGMAGCSINSGYENYAPVDTGHSGQGYNVHYENNILNTAHQNRGADEDYIVEITDPDFDFRVQEIQWNRDYYLGRTLRFEGMFLSSYWQGETIYIVARLGSGCCGAHGFEVYLNNVSRFDDETWVEVTGILEEFYVEEADRYFLRLNVISLEER